MGEKPSRLPRRLVENMREVLRDLSKDTHAFTHVFVRQERRCRVCQRDRKIRSVLKRITDWEGAHGDA